MGIIPLYIGWDKENIFYVSSELKSLEGVCKKIELFPPGHYLDSKTDKLTKWYDPKWKSYDSVKNSVTKIKEIHDSLSSAVKRQLMSDVPYGVLLSGGLDSSITSALAKKFASKRIESDDKQDAWWPQLHSFSVGLKGAPDLKAAKIVADHIGTVHHEINFTVQEGIDAIRDVIYHLETYDVTTVRASTPMYLMARAIKSLGIKNVKIINSSFGDLIEKAKHWHFNFIYFDGNHTEKATLSYFNWAVEKVSENDVFVFDDIYWSKEMHNAWRVILNHKKPTLTLDLFCMGIVFFNPNLSKQHIKLIHTSNFY